MRQIGFPTFQQLLHFTTPYYVANVLIIISYAPMRLKWMEHGLSKYARVKDLQDVATYEEQCAQAILAIVSAKLLWQKPTVATFVADLFLYIKAALITITFFGDQRLCVYFCITSLCVYMAAPQPYNDFVGDSKVELLTTESFPDLVSGAAKNVKWLVLFFTPNRHAHNLNADFARLSNLCSNEGQHFARVNMATSPDVLAANAESHILYQGSSLVMFQDGCEVGCLPDRTEEVDASTLTFSSIKLKFGLQEIDSSTEARSSSTKQKGVKRHK